MNPKTVNGMLRHIINAEALRKAEVETAFRDLAWHKLGVNSVWRTATFRSLTRRVRKNRLYTSLSAPCSLV